MGGAHAPAGPPPAGPAAGGPGVAGRGFISRLWGFEMTTPRPHVFMRKHCHNALPRVQYDVPLGGTSSDTKTHVVLRKGLKVHSSQTSGGVVLPVIVCSAMRHMCGTPRSAVAARHMGEAESTSAASMQLGNGWRLSGTSLTLPSSCRNRAAGTWAAHMPSGPHAGHRASRMLGGLAVRATDLRHASACGSARSCP